MLRRRSPPLLALAAALALAVGAAHADPAGDRERSRAAFASGAQALDEGRAKEALGYFEEAERLYPHYSTYYNIGLCERALGHPVLAAAAFHRFLEGGGSAVPTAQFEAVAGLIKEAEGKIAVLTIEVSPPAALVTLDGAAEAERTGKRIDPGQHVIEAKAPGHVAASKAFAAPPGAAVRVELALAPAPAPEAPAPSGPRLDALFWATAGLSAAALVTGAITGAVALSDSNAYADPATADDEAERRRSRGEVLRVVADVSFGVGITAGVGAALLATLRAPDPPAARGVRIQPGVASLGLSGRF